MRVNVGDASTSQSVTFEPANGGVFPSKANIYAVSGISEIDDEFASDSYYTDRLTEILENLGSPVQPSY